MTDWSLYGDQEFDTYLIKFVQCMYSLPNKDFWTLIGVIFSHPGKFKRDLRSFERTRENSVRYGELNFQIRSNDLKSRLNSPGWEIMTPMSVQESLFGKLYIHWTNLIK